MASIGRDNVVCVKDDVIDVVVLKRLKFVFKIVKALASQPNSRNRQAHVYIFEVLDAIGDWSGNPNDEISEMLDKQIFPQICRVISTFSNDEFSSFQQFFCKYIFTKWEETSNYIVLDFFADMYGFVSHIAPPSVAIELINIFQQAEVPSHVSMIILPSIIKNVSESVASNLADEGLRNFIVQQKESVSVSYLNKVVQFWTNLKNTVTMARSVYHLAPILNQCTATSIYLQSLQDNDLFKVLKSLTDWSRTTEWTANSDSGFLLISIIFLNSVCLNDLGSSNQNLVTILVQRMAAVTQGCCVRRVRVLTIQFLQRFMEYATDNDELLKEFMKIVQVDVEDNYCFDAKNYDTLMNTLESSLKNISSGGSVKFNDPERKRIRLMIDSLQKLLEDAK